MQMARGLAFILHNIIILSGLDINTFAIIWKENRRLTHLYDIIITNQLLIVSNLQNQSVTDS